MPYVLPVSLPWARVGNAYAWMTGTEAREVALKRAHLGLLTELKLYTDKIDAIQRVGDGLECVGCAVPPPVMYTSVWHTSRCLWTPSSGGVFAAKPWVKLRRQPAATTLAMAVTTKKQAHNHPIPSVLQPPLAWSNGSSGSCK